MKLTAKLAYSQLLKNKVRTIWTLIGIMLSTAMITAVYGFIASGYATFSQAFGEDGFVREAYILSVGLIGLILSAIIISASVIVISNAFRVSAGERMAQFSILKSVGATKRQIAASVIYESLFLSLIGIPAGIAVGMLISVAGVGSANFYINSFNNLNNDIAVETIIVFRFVIAWQAILASAVIAFLTILLSAWLPARKAAKISAIESIRGIGEVTIKAKEVRSSRFIQKLFGFEGTLATKTVKRNKRNFRAGVTSLAIGIVLFITASSIGGQMEQVTETGFAMPATVMVDYFSSISYFFNESGEREGVINVPINSETAQTVTEMLRGYENTPVFGMSRDWFTYSAVVPKAAVLPYMSETVVSRLSEELQTYNFNAELIAVDMENYIRLCELAGVPAGSNILINHYRHTHDNGRVSEITPFDFNGSLRLVDKYNGTSFEIPIHGELRREDIPAEFNIRSQNVQIVMPYLSSAVRAEWFANPADINGFMARANAVMNEMFPQYEDSLHTARVFKVSALIEAVNNIVRLVMTFVYGFITMLTLIGLTSVISTISTNVRMRSREFAVLKSVGMTRGGLNRMLNLESIMCSAKSLIIGLPIAVALTLLAHRAVLFSFEITYSIPLAAVIQCVFAVFAVTWLSMRYAAFRLRGQNIVETIRTGGAC